MNKKKEKKDIPISVNSLLFKTIAGNKTDEDGNLHISLDGGYEIVCHDVIGENVSYSPEVRSVYSDMKLSDKKGWILKSIEFDDPSENITISISPTSLADLDNGAVFYKFKNIGDPLRKEGVTQ